MRWFYLTAKHKFTLIILFGLATLYFNYRAIDRLSSQPEYKSKCDFKMAKYVIESLCDLYLNKKLIVGNMCSSLCNPENKLLFYEDKSFRKYELVGCYNSKKMNNENNENHFSRNEFYAGLKTVLVYEQLPTNTNEKRQTFVLKSRHQSFLDFDTHMEYDFKEKPIGTQLKYLLNFIRSSLFTNFGVSVDQEAIKWLDHFLKSSNATLNSNNKDLYYYVKLLSVDSFDSFEQFVSKKNKEKLGTFISNLLVLIYQEEYLFYRYFQNKPESLKISGTCGNFYAVEYAESLSRRLRFMNAEQRLNVALKFLKLVENLDKIYLNGSVKVNQISLDEELASNGLSKDESINFSLPLQICDVKLDNFGINAKGELKIIDTDMIKPNSYLFQPKFCNKHDDCHFFECKSFCEKNHCIAERVNNNLQSICEKIFDNNLKEESLVLSIENIEKINLNLVKFIDYCKSPGFYHNSDIPIAANQSLVKNLSSYLNVNFLIQ